MGKLEYRPASEPDLGPIAEVYSRVGFRDDLIDDVAFIRELSGGGLFVAQRNGLIVGAASALPFASTGWLGGIAVTPENQRLGIGRRLTHIAMEWLAEVGAETLLLHSTPAGRKLYADLGFRVQHDCLQLAHPTQAQVLAPQPFPIRRGLPGDLPSVLALDRQASDEDRRRLIEAKWPGRGLVAVGAGGEPVGYHLPIAAGALGAVIAGDEAAGVALLAAALADAPSARVAEPEGNDSAFRFLGMLGYAVDFRVTRMCLGAEPAHHPEKMFGLFNLYWG